MNEHLANLLLALGIFGIGFISIGPNILAIMGTSMERGRRHGMALALGVGIGSGIWATMTVAGLTALITAYAGALTVLKVFGAIYLLYLAYKAFRSAATRDLDTATAVATGDNLFMRGLLIQMTNPKAALHWIAIVAIGIGAQAPLWVGLTLIGATTLLSIFGHLAYAVMFSTDPVIAFYRRMRRWIDGTLGLFFTYAAFRIATYRE